MSEPEVNSFETALNNLNARLRLLETENNQLQVQLAEVNGTACKEPKVILPAKFNGDRSKCRSFLNQLKLVFSLQPSRYNTDQVKIHLLGSLLSDKAITWFNPYIENPEKYQALLNDWSAFSKLFSETFGESEKDVVAEQRIRQLSQGRMSMSSYAAEFRAIATDLDWNDAALMSQYRYGLNDTFKRMLLNFAKPSNLEELIALTIRCYNNWAENKNELRHSYHHFAAPRHPAPANQQSDAMEIDAIRRGPLTPEERNQRIQNQLCIVCGKPGHFKRNCPLSFRSTNPKNLQNQ